ncbi:MAG TPA: hypothetical protein VKF14_17010 [Candidatus Dormibacteraeota bacterium]|nr:hypothetical protein [Candidatus Dormibacteraeota bacterium]
MPEVLRACLSLVKSHTASEPERSAPPAHTSILQLLREHGDQIVKSSALIKDA